KVNVIGEKNNISNKIIKIISDIENKTKLNEKLFLNIAFNYGTDKEIISIIKNILKKNIDNVNINNALIRNEMYLSNMPDPDILIRTGGYKRLSNFLLMNLSYTELFFTETLWPDLKEKEILSIFEQFNKIKRNYGL
ncbi:MAG: Isoprenyl transferase, partial [Alphaproteobacteria bacterium MarineAlpha5_Bin7]